MRESHSVGLIVSTAESEAWQLRASVIARPHLLLGLCKFLEMDLVIMCSDFPEELIRLEEYLREARRLAEVFLCSGILPRELRRTLRGVLGTGRVYPDDQDQLNLSDSADAALRVAQQFASLGGIEVFPVHLLLAVLLAEDPSIAKAFVQLGISKKRLIEAARCELISRRPLTAMDEIGPVRWN